MLMVSRPFLELGPLMRTVVGYPTDKGAGPVCSG
jgi:hypothetical protein